MFVEASEPVDVSDSDLQKFWGADIAQLNAYQRLLLARLFKEVCQRRSVQRPTGHKAGSANAVLCLAVEILEESF